MVGVGGITHSFQWKGKEFVAVKDDVFALALPAVEELGYQLVDVEYVKEGPRWFVRIFLYRPEGVSLEDCQKVSSAVEALFETNDPVKTAYYLEVSSPGAERVLKHDREFHIFQGRLVKLTTKEPVEKEQVFYGQLGPVTENSVILHDPQGAPRSFERGNVKQIRLALAGSATAGK